VLKILTSNTRNPYLIWDNGCRAQLIDFLEDQRTASAREQYEDITDILNIASAFTLEAHK
jgi:DnaJ homolog subfamily C member 13